MVASALGWLLASFVQSEVTIEFADGNLVPALFWFLIAFSVFFISKRMKGDKSKNFGLLSPNFFITWFFCTVGVILGILTWIFIDTGELQVTMDQVTNSFFFYLPITIGTTLAASVGLSD